MPDERPLDLPGYPGGTDIVGNWVNQQFQLDAFGEALLLFAAAARHDHLDADGWRAAETAADAIEQRWREPDAGIWEIDPDALDPQPPDLRRRPARDQPQRPDGGEQAARWRRARRHDRRRHRCRLPAPVRTLAALARRPARRRRAAAARHPRRDPAPTTRAPIATLQRDRRPSSPQDGYCYRYRPDERPLGEAEGAFLLCGFWMALAYAQQGDHVSAARWFERNRAACGPPGLYSEEFDVRQRQLRGNLPQAFVHALLLETAATQKATGEPLSSPGFVGT